MDPDRHMEPDEFQKAWQADTSQTRVTIDADLLLKEVQRNQKDFRAMILFRDFREVLVALLLIPVWFYLGATTSSPWTWYLTVPALIWVAGFIVADRVRHTQKPSDPEKSLVESVKVSLTQVEHQNWLLRNILWWYLLPLAIPMLAFAVHVSWQEAIKTDDWLAALGFATILIVFLLGVFASIYYLNQKAVRAQLEPRRRELLTLLANLGDETAGNGGHDQVALPALPFAEARHGTPCTPTRIVISTIAAIVGLSLIVVMAKVMINTDPYVFTGEGYPRRSPFSAVRWQDSQPEVEVDGEWYRLVSLDDVPAEEILEFSRRTYGDRWQKRFEEDLVELLTSMGHPPEDEVTLVVQTLASGETRLLEDVPMTYANRQAIRNEAQARENSEP